MDAAAPMRGLSHPTMRFVPHWVAGGCAVVVGVGAAERAAGHSLGAPLAPFFAHWHPQAVLLAVPCALLLGAAIAVAPRLCGPSVTPLAFAAATFGIALALRLGLAAARGGPERWSAVFGTDAEAANEYLPALPALTLGLHAFLDRFAELAPSLPIHPSGHPPGMLVLLDLLGIQRAGAMAALTIAGGALAVPLTYTVGRSVLDERRARVAAALMLFAPSALLYGATSADALYATLALAAASCMLARGHLARVFGPAALAVASFFSFALLGAGAWALLVRRRAGPAFAAAGGVVGFYALLQALTGFDTIGTLQSASEAYRIGIANARPYWYWLLGSPVAFLVAMGLPLAWYALRALAARERTAVSLALVVAAAAVAGFTKAETERIWLFLVPLACVAAASALPSRRLAPVLALLACQALAVELLLGTIW
jgi:hypothetical protein